MNYINGRSVSKECHFKKKFSALSEIVLRKLLIIYLFQGHKDTGLAKLHYN